MKSTLLQVEGITSNDLLIAVSDLFDLKLAKIAATEPPPQDKYISRVDVCKLFTITLPTVHSWMNTGILKPYKIGHKTRFLLSEVKAAAVYIDSKNVKSL